MVRLDPDTLLVGTFDLIDADGWLEQDYPGDLIEEAGTIEIDRDGNGSFQIGDLEGVLKVQGKPTKNRIRWRWFAEWGDEMVSGTGSAGMISEAEGMLDGRFKCRGEDRPWDFTAQRRASESHPNQSRHPAQPRPL